MKTMAWNKSAANLSVALSLGVGCLFASGCATLSNGVSQSIPIMTSPTGAHVEIDGKIKQSPCIFKLSRRRNHRMTISKPGYETYVQEIAHVRDGAIRGNLIAGGLIGFGVDLITGAGHKLLPEQIDVVLVATGDGVTTGEPIAQAAEQVADTLAVTASPEDR